LRDPDPPAVPSPPTEVDTVARGAE